MGKSENNQVRTKRVYDKEQRDVIVPAHPEEDVSALRTDKKKKVMRKEKNHNITPFVQLSSRLNQHSIRWDLSERKRYLRKYALPVQQKASQSDSHPPHAHVDHKLHKFGPDRSEQHGPIDCKSRIG